MKRITKRIGAILCACVILAGLGCVLYYLKNQKGSRFLTLTLPFSAGKTQFSLSINLPEAWAAQKADPHAPTEGFFAVEAVLIGTGRYRVYCGETYVGSLLCAAYEAPQDSPNWAIYGQLVYGNQYSWDTQLFYKTVSDRPALNVATTQVSYSASAALANGLGERAIENYGILAYSKTAPVYIAFEIDPSQISEAQLARIAKSVSFSLAG